MLATATLALPVDTECDTVAVGLGKRDDLTPERLRAAAAAVHERARDLGARRLCWELPHKVGTEHAQAIVEGTALSAYRFDRYKSPSAEERPRLQELVVAAHDDVGDAVVR